MTPKPTMKEIKERRFQKNKPEDIGFAAPSMAERSSVRPNTRPDVRPKEQPLTVDQTTPAYIISLPATRRKIRHAFDIYEDHLDALKKSKWPSAIFQEREAAKPSATSHKKPSTTGSANNQNT